MLQLVHVSSVDRCLFVIAGLGLLCCVLFPRLHMTIINTDLCVCVYVLYFFRHFPGGVWYVLDILLITFGVLYDSNGVPMYNDLLR